MFVSASWRPTHIHTCNLHADSTESTARRRNYLAVGSVATTTPADMCVCVCTFLQPQLVLCAIDISTGEVVYLLNATPAGRPHWTFWLQRGAFHSHNYWFTWLGVVLCCRQRTRSTHWLLNDNTRSVCDEDCLPVYYVGFDVWFWFAWKGLMSCAVKISWYIHNSIKITHLVGVKSDITWKLQFTLLLFSKESLLRIIFYF